ncbi:hypothetical protein [Hymenobacter antarcticus]|uniref:Uncharacterized protein n=1 Tax=Hymenobacter antarcticus TaxID=486270 RepID=A0ABP7QHM3_9BACT
MALNYATATPLAQPSPLARTLYVWLFSNLGGTALLVLDFGLEHPGDVGVPLLIGLMTALISLAYVPLALPFFALAQRACVGWKCRILAVSGVIVVFGLANFLLLQWLPIGTLGSLLNISQPYLGAALLTVAWLYWPLGVARPVRFKPKAAAGLLGVWWSSPRRAKLVH